MLYVCQDWCAIKTTRWPSKNRILSDLSNEVSSVFYGSREMSDDACCMREASRQTLQNNGWHDIELSNLTYREEKTWPTTHLKRSMVLNVARIY